MRFHTGVLRKWSRLVLPAVLLIAVAVLPGCDMTRNYLKIDRSGNNEFQDYRDALAPRNEESADADDAADGDGGIPALQSYIVEPSENMKAMPLVSVSVNQTVPLRDVIYDLAQQAGYDVELDPAISGAIIFTAKERPFDLVIDRIAEMGRLRYTFKDGVLRVEKDRPYNKTYKIDYLSYVRSSSSSIDSSVSVGGGDGESGGGSGGSSFSAEGSSEADFWAELDTNLKQILGTSAGNSLVTGSTPQVTTAEANPAPVQPVVTPTPAGGANVQVQPPAATLQVTPLPSLDSGGEGEGEGGEEPEASYAVNKLAGMITVFATERQHRQVAGYLKDLHRAVTAQVLIEAKVLQVELNDTFSAGIDWTLTDIIKQIPQVNFSGSGGGAFNISYTSGDLNALIGALAAFGTTKALSSPRLTVLNNQAAILNVANNVVYFTLEIETDDDETSGRTTTVTSTQHTVPEGVLINVQPSINLDDRTISMAVRPTVTKIGQFVDDPGVIITASAAGVDPSLLRGVPEVNIQQMDSVIRMNSGQAIVMGGLMQDGTISDQSGVPVLSEMPVFGALFRSQGDEVNKTELVIFLKATILDSPEDTVGDTDRDLYRTFSEDRRPLKL